MRRSHSGKTTHSRSCLPLKLAICESISGRCSRQAAHSYPSRTSEPTDPLGESCDVAAQNEGLSKDLGEVDLPLCYRIPRYIVILCYHSNFVPKNGPEWFSYEQECNKQKTCRTLGHQRVSRRGAKPIPRSYSTPGMSRPSPKACSSRVSDVRPQTAEIPSRGIGDVANSALEGNVPKDLSPTIASRCSVKGLGITRSLLMVVETATSTCSPLRKAEDLRAGAWRLECPHPEYSVPMYINTYLVVTYEPISTPPGDPLSTANIVGLSEKANEEPW